MEQKEKIIINTFDGVPYPLIITSDRYRGAYSGGSFIAYYCYSHNLPTAVDGGDIPCMEYWENPTVPFGRGESPNEAMDDLLRKYTTKEMLNIKK